MNCTPKVRQKTFGVQFINLNYDTASFLQGDASLTTNPQGKGSIH